jgi:hypothetical protein
MNLFAKLKAYAGVLRQAKRPLDALPLLRQRKALLLGVNGFELAMMASNRVEARLKALAQIKTSALIGCPF